MLERWVGESHVLTSLDDDEWCDLCLRPTIGTSLSLPLCVGCIASRCRYARSHSKSSCSMATAASGVGCLDSDGSRPAFGCGSSMMSPER